MKTKLHSCLGLYSLLILAFSAASALATTYYIDPSAADDSADGLSLTTPWKTFDVAFDGAHVQAGDTVILRGGVYRPNPAAPWYQHVFREVLTSTPDASVPGTVISGTPGHMITIKAYLDEKPVLKGSLVIDSGSWTQVGSSHIYWTSWDQPDDYVHADRRFSNCQQVFVSSSETVDGTSLRQVSWPSITVTDPSETVSWQYYGIGVPASSASGRPDPSFNSSPYDNATDISTVMTQGSFFYDDNQKRIYVWLPNGNAPGATGNEVIEASTSQTVVYLSNYYHLKGLAIKHGNSMLDCTGIILGEHCLVENCDIEWNGGWGIQPYANTTITCCIISNNGEGGYAAAQANLVLSNCLVQNNNYRFYSRRYAAGGVKLIKGCVNCIVENCEVTGNWAPGVWFDTAPESDIVKYDGMTDIFQTNGVNSMNIVRNNYIHDNTGYIDEYSSISAYGIELEVSKGIEVYNNILLRNTGYGIQMGNSCKCSVHDNIIAATVGDGDPTYYTKAISMSGDHRTDHNADSPPWIYLSTNNEIFDNIILDNGSIWLDKNSSTVTPSSPSLAYDNMCDYNVYFRSGGNFHWIQTQYPLSYVDCTSLSGWSTSIGYDIHSYYGDPGFAAQGGLDAMIAHLGVIKAADPNATGVIAGVSLGCSTEALQTIVFDGLITGMSGSVDNTSGIGQKIGSGLNWEAGPSTGNPGTDLAGGFFYRSDSGQTYARNWLLTGDAFGSWGDFGLFVSSSGTGNPSLARYYHDAITNATTIGHNTTSQPQGTDTLTIEGTTSLIPPQAGSTGTPSSRVLVLGARTTDGTVTELTTNGATPDTSGNTNRVVLSLNRTALVTATIMGRQATGGSTGLSKYIVKALYVKGNGSALTLGGSDTVATFAESGTTSWGFAFDVSGSVVRIKINGAASTIIDWSARVEVTEVGN